MAAKGAHVSTIYWGGASRNSAQAFSAGVVGEVN